MRTLTKVVRFSKDSNFNCSLGIVTKRRSEEPLFPLFKKLVDETVIDSDIEDSKSVKSDKIGMENEESESKLHL